MRKKLWLGCVCAWILYVICSYMFVWDTKTYQTASDNHNIDNEKDFIKWVDFNVTNEAMTQAYEYDVASYKEKIRVNWIELLAYVGAKTGGDFSAGSKVQKEMETVVQKLQENVTMEELTKDLPYYSYYLEAYTAVLDGLVGEYEIQTVSKDTELSKSGNVQKTAASTEKLRWEKCYGLKGFSPIAKGFEYYDYDDFGVSRSYGYERKHLGHDMMGQVGTPIIAVESGYVEAIGWNRYGGWRLGIRSFDKKRYYYYAHLRKDYPYYSELKEGSVVKAGDVIGYLGRTGYSTNENVNNIDTAHLHFGVQLIFDESQKEGVNEIWIDCYELVKFLYKNRSETYKKEGTKEWVRVRDIKDPAVAQYEKNAGKDEKKLEQKDEQE